MPSNNQPGSSPLARFDGRVLYGAAEAILKGLLEAETPVSQVTVGRGETFGALLRACQDEGAAEMLRGHDLRVLAVPTAARAVTLARYAARSGHGAIALVPNDQLADATAAIQRAVDVRPDGGTLCLVLEDRPEACPAACPRRLARLLDLPAIEASGVNALRDAMESGPRMARAAGRPVAVIVHASVLQTAATVEARPNRMIESVDAMLARRRRGRRPRLAESEDVLRMVRRLELNQAASLPSPGERMPLGFVTIGPADGALRHITHALQLTGRVPLLHLGAIHPVDPVSVSRLLLRCERVVVLEPRPGAIEPAVLEIAEDLRRRGDRPGAVYGRRLPPEKEGEPPELAIDDAVHPSLLARRIVHLLHMIRPGGRVAAQLLPDASEREVVVPARGATIGAGAAAAALRRVAVDVDQWLRDQREEDESAEAVSSALAIDGADPPGAPDRVVVVEIWEAARFQREGIAALRQAARDARPWILLVCEVGEEDGQDLERLARGAIPAERADRVKIEIANISEPARMTEILRAAALLDQMTVVVARDAPPARYDVAAIERSLAEVDRLGFDPRQRVVWPVDRACAVRPPVDEDTLSARALHDHPRVRTETRVDRVPRRGGGAANRMRLRVRPMLEEVEVIRTRPPARRWRRTSASGLGMPDVVHARAPVWRAHIAGFVGSPPGLAARIICRAGREMGYAVSCRFDAHPIGSGRRAWAEVLFTHPREGEATPPMSVRVPFGEADLLIGLDAAETLRAIRADPALRVARGERTFAVVNSGPLGDESDTEGGRELRKALRDVLRGVSRPQPRLVDDVAGACRAWFHTDRLAGVALLGAAFQLGLIPVQLDAIEHAVADTEREGFGRAMEALQFGRHLSVDQRLFSRPRDDRDEPVDRIVRRYVHLIGRAGWRRGNRARDFRRLLEGSMQRMPGLSETDAGRKARRDFVIALYRCQRWGGVDCADRYARLITELYVADRGDRGRALTRYAILPLAGATLIRDPIYVAAMATSAEQRRRTRRALNVKLARDDEIERRYLTRFEITAFERRFRLDLRTSDWAAHVVGALRHLIPWRWRGTRRERDLRAFLAGLVEEATAGAGRDYDHFQDALHRLHQQALENRLRGMALSEVKMLAEGTKGQRD